MSNSQQCVTHPGGRSLAAGAERPEHGVAQALQNLQQHLREDKRAESESRERFGRRVRQVTGIFKDQNKNERAGCSKKKKKKNSSLEVDTSCGAAAAQPLSRRGDRSSNSFHRQRSWQLATREEKVASVNLESTWGSYCNERPKLTCGKPWVFSAWLKFLPSFHRRQKSSPPARRPQYFVKWDGLLRCL